jgi:hypothetical protein
MKKFPVTVNFFTFLRFVRLMGIRYFIYRLGYALFKHTQRLTEGIAKESRPPLFSDSFSQSNAHFFFHSKQTLPAALMKYSKRIAFPSIPKGEQWRSNPDSGHTYPLIHWSRTRTFRQIEGDIKTVWDPSRFGFLYALLRIDYHEGRDLSETVFQSMEDWLETNPLHRGPNWVCGQEIAIRTFSWTFALFYYRDNSQLTTKRRNVFLQSIRSHTRRVASSTRFTQVLIRNNHALCEALLLYVIGTVFPFFPESPRWKQLGKSFFEKELEFQVTSEGAFLQHSMNYHRMVVQLTCWALQIAHLNGDRWGHVVYQRSYAMLDFLQNFQDPVTGWLPNYGPNDGALIFPLSATHTRDYRPQLALLATLLAKPTGYPEGAWMEETCWITGHQAPQSHPKPNPAHCISYAKSGFFAFRVADSYLFTRCASYRTRPSQSDNLHIDLWRNGKNLLVDAGTYRYNTEDELQSYYAGTEGHNTAALEGYDQMRRGPRFIWTHWIQNAQANCYSDGEYFYFDGEFLGYTHVLAKGVTHRRTIRARLDFLEILVTDTFTAKPDHVRIRQLWHPSDEFHLQYTLSARSTSGAYLTPMSRTGWYSETYNTKEERSYLEFSTYENSIHATIRSKIKN